MMNKRIKVVSISALLILIFSVVAFTNIASNTEKVSYVSVNCAINPENINELIGYYDYVFTGVVKEHLGNYKDQEMTIPYNLYKVEVIDNLKGKLKKEVIIKKTGGYVDNELILLKVNKEEDFLPKVGEQYVFIATTQKDGGLLVETAFGNEPISEGQNEKIKNKYIKAVNEQIKFERERFKSKYEME